MTDEIIGITIEIRQAMWQQGYRPIPVLNRDSGYKGAGKRPAGSGPDWSRWEQDARQDIPYAVTNSAIAQATNTGILADGLRPVDADVDDPHLAEVIDRLAVEILGNAPKRFREDSPRWLRLYRAAEGQPSHIEVLEDEATARAAGRKKPWGVEVLGAGNQFVAIGRHPGGAFLDWADERSPVSVSRDDLPSVTEAQVEEFLAVVGDLLGAKTTRQTRQDRPVNGQIGNGGRSSVGVGGFVSTDGTCATADVQAALAVIEGDGGAYKAWVRVGLAIFAATNGSPEGEALFDEWSRKSPKYDAESVRKAWRTFRPSSVSFGTLVHLAREIDPAWRAPSWSADRAGDGAGDVQSPPIAISILDRTVAPPPKLPLTVFGPDWEAWLQQAAVAANAPVDYVSATLLAAAGSLVGNARWGQAWPGWAEPSVLWVGLVGEPSASKTPASNAVLKLLRQVEADMAEGFDEVHAAWEEAVARAKAERKQWEASVANGDHTPMPRTIVPPEPLRPLASTGSVTIEKVARMMQSQPKGFLISNDELAGWLSNLQRYSGGNDRPFYLTAWTGGPYRVDRVTSATATIPCLSLGVMGTIQPDRLAATLQGADDGLPARFLYCWPNARPFARPRGTIAVNRATEALCRLGRLGMAAAEDGSPTPVLVPATDEAAETLADFAREMQVRERHAGGLMIGVLGKARGYTLRLATVLEYLQWAWSGDRREPAEITAKAMRRAVELMLEYFLPMASRVLGDAAITPQERDARTLAKWIAVERPHKINLRRLSRGETGDTPMYGLRERKRLDSAADWLLDAGWLRREPAAKIGGRPPSDLLIASGLWAALNERDCQNHRNQQPDYDAVESVRFVGDASQADEHELSSDYMFSNGSKAEPQIGTIPLLPAPDAPTAAPKALTVPFQTETEKSDAQSTLLARLTAKMEAAAAKRRLST